MQALRPTEPLAYLELAEEVADAARDDEQRALARHLFGLAGVLDPHGLGRSACLALADIEPDANAKRRLLALASLLPGGGRAVVISPTPISSHSAPSPQSAPADARQTSAASSAALAVAEALTLYRLGQGAQAQGALREPGAAELLETIGRLLPGGLNRFNEDLRHYRGQLRPGLTQSDVDLLLRLESALLLGHDRSWSGELLLTEGRPLIEVDPDRLAESLGVDGSRALYRGGRWVAQ